MTNFDHRKKTGPTLDPHTGRSNSGLILWVLVGGGLLSENIRRALSDVGQQKSPFWLNHKIVLFRLFQLSFIFCDLTPQSSSHDLTECRAHARNRESFSWCYY